MPIDIDGVAKSHSGEEAPADGVTEGSLTDSFLATSVDASVGQVHRELQVGDRLGAWRIVGLIGSGGMGEVYRAERDQGDYQQTVALKVMPAADGEARRFEQERQRLASLDHPGVSRIIDGGGNDSILYMAMEFVDGVPIDRYVEDRALSRRARLGLFLELCSAVSYAHERMILHRDIKPANVLVDSAAHVRLIDFGIASLMDTEEAAPGALTRAFAAPEQIAQGPQTAATDVFSLGALLHVLVTGKRPERRADRSLAIDANAIRNRELVAILNRATALDPSQRYVSVEALSKDVLAWLEHRPVEAFGGDGGYVFSRFVRRFPVASTLFSAFMLTLAAGLVISLALMQKAESESRKAREELARSEYFLKSAKTSADVESAYNDLLQRMFGDDADVERMTGIMMTRWAEAQSRHKEEPDRAALISYVIGRYFVSRNDFQTALKILEPWLADGYGDESVVAKGNELMPVIYYNMGRNEEAIPYLRVIEKRYSDGFEAFSGEHAAAASQLANASGDAEDVSRADFVIREAMKSAADDPQMMIFYWNQLGIMKRQQGDLEGGYEATRKIVEILETHTLTEVTGRDVARMNLAAYEYYYRHDLDRTAALVDATLTQDIQATGVNRQYGRAMELKGLVAGERGDAAGAESDLREAVDTADRFSGRQSVNYHIAALSLAEFLADQSRFSEALTIVEDVSANLGAGPSGFSRNRLALAEAYILAKQGTDAEGMREAFARIELEPVERHHILRYLYHRLLEELEFAGAASGG